MFNPTPPLAERMRPQHLDEIVGQSHLVGPAGIIRQFLTSGHVPSMIFWGPPGVGKTTLAMVIARQINANIAFLSAVSAGVKEVREVIHKAKGYTRSILFIDEIHRFNKSQQDALLGAVEKGILILIGATTENPSFEVNAALLSRCQVYRLYELKEEEIQHLIHHAVTTDEILREKSITITEYEAFIRLSGGDARRLLNLLEMAVMSENEEVITINNQKVQAAAQTRAARYDKQGEQHYDIISAFIKSIRGSDPNAGVYYLARMIEGGEDPVFIARRLLILASEDIGNANPTALVLATSCFQAVSFVGFPEAEIILSQCTTYLAGSPKSNASYKAIRQARRKVSETGDLPVPLHLRNAPTRLMKESGYGADYQYAHDFPGNFAAQEFLPDTITNTTFYEPGDNAREAAIRKFLKALWQEKYNY